FLEQAREITPPGVDRAALAEGIGSLQRLANRHQESEAAFRDAIAELDAHADTVGSARAGTGPRRPVIGSTRGGEAADLLETALGRLDLDSPDPLVAEAAASLARAYMASGREEQGLIWADRALAIAERADAPGPLLDALITRGWAVASL